MTEPTSHARDIFQSSRLTFHAIDVPEDLPMFLATNADRLGYQNSNASNVHLPRRSEAEEFMKAVAEKSLFSAIICIQIPPDGDRSQLDRQRSHDPDSSTWTRGIGQVHLKGSRGTNQQHHRNAEIGIDILPEYQGQGYGTEALRWIMKYAFYHLGLHRLSIGAFGWNEGAIRLYRRVGFKVEGRARDAFWHNGRWWDDVSLGMLEDEYRMIEKAVS